MNDLLPDSNTVTPTTSAAPGTTRRALVQASFSPDTPAAIRERLLDAVFAVLEGEDDD